MSGSKIEKLRAFVQANPGDARARFFLASELFKESEWAAASAEFEEYLASAPADPAAARKSLGLCYEKLGRDGDAGTAYRRAIEEALAYGHSGLAEEIRGLLEDLEG